MSVNERAELNKAAREIDYTDTLLVEGTILYATSIWSEQS